jgi:hypothetical protein
MASHKTVNYNEIADLPVFDLINSFVDFVDEIYCSLEVLFYRVLRNYLRVFYLFVIEESLAEVYVSLAPFLLSL